MQENSKRRYFTGNSYYTQKGICTMTSFDYNYQNPLGFRFLVQITPFVLDTPLGLQNLNKKRKTKWILVDVVR